MLSDLRFKVWLGNNEFNFQFICRTLFGVTEVVAQFHDFIGRMYKALKRDIIYVHIFCFLLLYIHQWHRQRIHKRRVQFPCHENCQLYYPEFV